MKKQRHLDGNEFRRRIGERRSKAREVIAFEMTRPQGRDVPSWAAILMLSLALLLALFAPPSWLFLGVMAAPSFNARAPSEASRFDVGSSQQVTTTTPVVPTVTQVNQTTGAAVSSLALSCTMTLNRMPILAVLSYRAAGAPNTPTCTSSSRTWTQATTIAFGTNRRLTMLFTISAGTVTENVTADFSSQSQDNICFVFYEWQTVNLDGLLNLGVDCFVQTQVGTALAASSVTNNALNALESDGSDIFIVAANSGVGTGITAGTGYTLVGSRTDAAANISMHSERTTTLPGATTGSMAGSTRDWGCIAIELRSNYQMLQVGSGWLYTAADWQGYDMYVEGDIAGASATDLGLLELYDNTAGNTAGGSSFSRTMKAISASGTVARVRAATKLAGLVDGHEYIFRGGSSSNNTGATIRSARIVAKRQ